MSLSVAWIKTSVVRHWKGSRKIIVYELNTNCDARHVFSNLYSPPPLLSPLHFVSLLPLSLLFVLYLYFNSSSFYFHLLSFLSFRYQRFWCPNFPSPLSVSMHLLVWFLPKLSFIVFCLFLSLFLFLIIFSCFTCIHSSSPVPFFTTLFLFYTSTFSLFSFLLCPLFASVYTIHNTRKSSYIFPPIQSFFNFILFFLLSCWCSSSSSSSSFSDMTYIYLFSSKTPNPVICILCNNLWHVHMQSRLETNSMNVGNEEMSFRFPTTKSQRKQPGNQITATGNACVIRPCYLTTVSMWINLQF